MNHTLNRWSGLRTKILLAKGSLANQISNCTNNAFACEASLDIRLLVHAKCIPNLMAKGLI